MTKKEITNEIKCLLSELDNGEDAVSYLTQNDVNWLNENIKALEQEPIIDKIRAEIEKQEKWLLQAGYNAYNVDIAFNSIKLALAESEGE